EGVLAERQAIAENGDLRAARPTHEHGGHHVRARHRAVAVLMVLVHAEAIPAEALRVFELIEILVVELLADLGIVVAVGERHPRRRLVVIHHVRHQVEVVELHRRPAPAAQNSMTASATASGSSRWGTWPEASKMRSRASEMSDAHARPHGSSGASRSCAPQQSS